MPRQGNLNRRILVRMDDETDRLLTAIANQMKTTRVEAVRKIIRLTADDSITRKIADRLEAIERRLAVGATAGHIEQISKQLGDVAESINTNSQALALGIKKIIER